MVNGKTQVSVSLCFQACRHGNAASHCIAHDILFTLARNYPMNADHDIEYIYHQYLVANHAGNSSKAEVGAEGVHAVEQLL